MSSNVSLAEQRLSQGVGYGVIIGLGAFFAIVVVFISHTLAKYGSIKRDSEEFSVARRSLGTGIVASAVVSSWTWSVTLLSSCSTAYNYGVAGAFMYAASNTSQIVFFANLAVQIKRKAPDVHTHLELAKIRYGTLGHITFAIFGLAVNILVCSSVLVGAGAAVNAIAGVNIYAALWLLPFAVVAYTLRGGLRSTIFADYLHTTIIFIIIFVLFLRTYATSPVIGSPGVMYRLILQASNENPAAPADNYMHSYLTVKSPGAIKFGVLSLLEYTGVVLSDSSFYQKGIAASPTAAMPGYFIGGLAWFSIPFCLATTAGLAALALGGVVPGFDRMTKEQVNAGLTLVYAARAVLGSGGSAAVLLLMFMSSTSAISAQLVAVSTVCAYDIHKTHIDPKATPEKTLRVNQIVVVAFGAFIAAFACLLHGVGVDLNLLYNMTGVFSGAPIAPLLFTFFSSRLPRWAVFPGVWIGFGAGVGVWLGTAKVYFGTASNIANLSDLNVCLFGCAASIGVSTIICVIGTVFFPEPFDWDSIPARLHSVGVDGKDVNVADSDGYDKGKLDRALKLGGIGAAVVFLTIFIIWPFSLFRDYIFTEKFFTGWVIVSFIWSIIAFCAVGIYPLYEGIPMFKNIFAALSGKKFESTYEAENNEKVKQLSKDEGSATPSDVDAEKDAQEGSGGLSTASS